MNWPAFPRLRLEKDDGWTKKGELHVRSVGSQRAFLLRSLVKANALGIAGGSEEDEIGRKGRCAMVV
ncbi:MAG: hypothetical protein ACE5GK_07200 [Nitrospiria bacterium]